MDGLFMVAATDRPVRFLVDAGIFKHGLLKLGIHIMGGIPVSPKLGPDEINRALRAAGDALDHGEVVCIFPEGQITRTGSLQGFRRGIERIAAERDGVIVPVHLDRVWGSIFSREKGRFFFKMPKRIPYPITVAYGDPLPTSATANDVRNAVADLGAEAWEMRKRDRTTLHRRAIRVLRRRPWKLQFADATKPNVSRFTALVGAIVLARKLAPLWHDQDTVGVMLPPSVGGALVNIAASICGKTIVNLNYTIGEAGMASAVRQARLKSVVSAKVFCAKADVRLPQKTTDIWLAEVAETIGRRDRIVAILLALFAPIRLIERACGNRRPQRVDNIATIIFSSGSTGEPKGIPLSHFNINANVEQVAQVFRPEPTDRLLGILPLFHSFGAMALWFSVNRKMPTAFQPNPLDAQAVGKIVARYRITLMLATPTLLSIYTRGCKATQFGSLRLVVAGAEKLTDVVRDAFEDRFGVRPFEGYGATECAPAIAVGTPDFRAPGFYQPGSRRGYIGQPLPGLAVKVVDPETYERLGPDEEGLVLVTGPNVFDGYLRRPELTEKAFHDGWYITGDIGKQDRDGYLAITDRASRFAKIGGEMIPCCVVERALHHAAGEDKQTFAVTVLRDPRRGEKLAVVHTWDGDIDTLLDKARADGLPNLFTPKPRDFHRVSELPTLGTGKTDLRGVKELAEGGGEESP
jgi:acyl-[acyl-carrier-protein]-phospholipid O-acyltransferase/long-chain-fatty-acid--[acyl-carrier-protein] ligase